MTNKATIDAAISKAVAGLVSQDEDLTEADFTHRDIALETADILGVIESSEEGGWGDSWPKFVDDAVRAYRAI